MQARRRWQQRLGGSGARQRHRSSGRSGATGHGWGESLTTCPAASRRQPTPTSRRQKQHTAGRPRQEAGGPLGRADHVMGPAGVRHRRPRRPSGRAWYQFHEHVQRHALRGEGGCGYEGACLSEGLRESGQRGVVAVQSTLCTVYSLSRLKILGLTKQALPNNCCQR